MHNGGRVLPGTYHLHLQSGLNPYVKAGVRITEEDTQEIEIIVPVGHVTVRYQKPDGSPDKDVRFWIGKGANVKGLVYVKRAGKRIPLLSGTYNVKAWERKGKIYDHPVFSIEVGEEEEIILQAKP